MDAMIKDKTKSRTMSSKTLGKYFLKTVKIDEAPWSGVASCRNMAKAAGKPLFRRATGTRLREKSGYKNSPGQTGGA